MKNARTHTIKKLLKNSLTPKERIELTGAKSVSAYMQKQWDRAFDAAQTDNVAMARLQNETCKKAWANKVSNHMLYYKIYSRVATLFLVLAIGGMIGLYTNRDNPFTTYVVSSGIKDIKSVQLPDGSIVRLGPGSELKYPGEFKGGERRIILSGQAFFDVAKDPDKPFIVQTDKMDITALGTAFEVFSYDEESYIETILLNGKVKIRTRNENENGGYILSPDEKLTLTKNNLKVAIEKVDADKYTAWRSLNMLCFENEKLSVIIPRLEQWFGRRVICRSDVAGKYSYTFKVRDESLERILFMFSQSSDVKFKKLNDDYELF